MSLVSCTGAGRFRFTISAAVAAGISGPADTRVAHEQVDPSFGCDRPLDEPVGPVGLSQVSCQRDGPGASCHRLQSLLIAAGQQQSRSGLP
jgi:hypothetical protein